MVYFYLFVIYTAFYVKETFYFICLVCALYKFDFHLITSAQATKEAASDNTDAEDLDSDEDGDYDNEIEINSGNELSDRDKIIAEEIDNRRKLIKMLSQ